ncbi:MAG: VTT domain-containing protein [Parvularculaceae bacterium]|nr:VTT domain-containing protein [Parvularculaceae bacterium]
MVEYWRRLQRRLSKSDPRVLASFGLSVSLAVVVVLMIMFGRDWLRLDEEGEIRRIFAQAAASHLALAGVIALYSFLALTGFPQVLLFLATVLAFGPGPGAAYAWIGTMVSAVLTFYLGRLFGGEWVLRWGGPKLKRAMEFLGRHGALASGLIRVVPSGPFIAVNAAAGAARIPLWKYLLGTGVGIVPKIALVAAIGVVAPTAADLDKGLAGVVAFFHAFTARDLALTAGVVAAWVGLMVGARWWWLRIRRRDQNY